MELNAVNFSVCETVPKMKIPVLGPHIWVRAMIDLLKN